MNKKISKIINQYSYFFENDEILIKRNRHNSKRISIGIIVDTAFTIPPKTGVCYRLYYLSKELFKNGINIKIFLCNRNYNNDDNINELSREKDLEIHLIPEKIFYNLKSLFKIIKSSRVDAIQFEDSETAILLGGYLKEKLNVPLFLELHDNETIFKKSIGGYKYSDLVLTNFVHYISGELADLIIITTKGDAKDFIEDVGISSAKLVVSPNGVDPKLPYYGPNIKEKNIIFIGNLFYPPNRQAMEIIFKKILPKLSSQHFQVTFVGIAPKELVNKYTSQNIIFTGFVNNLNRELKKATIALCPVVAGSGMKVKILNFAAAGLPIISTTIGANGYEDLKSIILEDDISKYSKIIQKLRQKPNLIKEIGKQNRKDIIKYFSWSKIAKELANIYHIHITNYNRKLSFKNHELLIKKVPKPFWLTEKRVEINQNPNYYIIKNGKVNKRKL